MVRLGVSQRDAFRHFLSGHRAAEARALQLMREEGPLSSEEAFAGAMELCDLVDDDATDPLRERDDAHARAIWAKLRAWAANRVPQT